MKNWRPYILGFLTFLCVGSYFLGLSFSYAYYIVSAMQGLFVDAVVPLKALIGWSLVGLSLSILASLATWPFALSVATLLEHNKVRRGSQWTLKTINYLSSMPLLLFVFVYIEVIGSKGFMVIKSFWSFIFTSSNFFTQAVAFALTLILYPFSFFPFFGEPLTIDLFYKEMLAAVIEFAEVGLVASVVILGLFLYLLPKMILHIRKQLRDDESLRSFEIIKSIGGTPWESIQLTVFQAMKTRFNSIILYFTRLSFFEGLITYSLLLVFFIDDHPEGYRWSTSLSSQFLNSALFFPDRKSILLVCSGSLVIVYALFSLLEIFLRPGKERAGV